MDRPARLWSFEISLDNFLTARYCLYAARPGDRIFRAEIHHIPWPLQPATADIAENTLATSHGLALPDCPPLLHYAHRLDVLVSNAGISTAVDIESLTVEEFDALFAVNLGAPYFLVQQLLPALGESRSIVLASSRGGR